MACYSDSVFRASGGPTLAAAASHSSLNRAMALRSAWFGTTSVYSSRWFVSGDVPWAANHRSIARRS